MLVPGAFFGVSPAATGSISAAGYRAEDRPLGREPSRSRTAPVNLTGTSSHLPSRALRPYPSWRFALRASPSSEWVRRMRQPGACSSATSKSPSRTPTISPHEPISRMCSASAFSAMRSTRRPVRDPTGCLLRAETLTPPAGDRYPVRERMLGYWIVDPPRPRASILTIPQPSAGVTVVWDDATSVVAASSGISMRIHLRIDGGDRGL